MVGKERHSVAREAEHATPFHTQRVCAYVRLAFRDHGKFQRLLADRPYSTFSFPGSVWECNACVNASFVPFCDLALQVGRRLVLGC